MRVGLFIERFNPARGGRERSTAEIARLLAERGCEVEIVCIEGVARDEFNVVALGASGVSRVGRFRSFVKAARRYIAGAGYDVTHAMFPLPGVDVYQLRGGTYPGLRAGHLRRCGPVGRIIRRATWPINRLRAYGGRLERLVMADPATMCLPVSAMVAEEIGRYYGRTENVREVLNGAACPTVDPATRAQWRAETRRQWGLADDDVAIVCPAMNPQLKGCDHLVEAFAQTLAGGVGRRLRLIVLGSVAKPAAKGAHVQSHPAMANIFPAYAAADAVAILSWYDACSRVVLEAVGFGLPCVTTRYNGAAEVLADGAGLVVSSPDAADEVSAALASLADPACRAECAARCEQLTHRVSMARHVDELMAVYSEIAR